MRRPRIAGGNARGHGNRFTPAAGRGGTERRRQGLYGDRRRWVSDRAARLSPCEGKLRRRAAGNAVRPRRRLVPRFAGAVRSALSGAGQRHWPGDPVSRLPSGAGIPVSAAAGRCLSGALLGGATGAAVGDRRAAPGGGRRQRRGNLAAAVALLARIAAARTSSASCCCTRRSAARWRRRAIASLPRGTF